MEKIFIHVGANDLEWERDASFIQCSLQLLVVAQIMANFPVSCNYWEKHFSGNSTIVQLICEEASVKNPKPVDWKMTSNIAAHDREIFGNFGLYLV